MNIWHVENKYHTGLMLWRNKENIFQLTIRGEYMDLLTNSDYILLDKKYTSLLNPLSDQVTLHDAKVVDLNLKIEKDNYIELKIQHEIDIDSIEKEDGKGLKMWEYSGHVFVSEDLKNELTKISNEDFVFTPGFSNFGG